MGSLVPDCERQSVKLAISNRVNKREFVFNHSCEFAFSLSIQSYIDIHICNIQYICIQYNIPTYLYYNIDNEIYVGPAARPQGAVK